MRLTTNQRLMVLERETAILHDTIKLLHKMLKDQGQLINEHIVQRLADAEDNPDARQGNGRPEREVFTFVCKRRFDKLEQDIRKTMKLVENLRFGLKAG